MEKASSVVRRALLAAVALVAAACSGSSSAGADSPAPVTLRLGYFPNVTHATAIAGVETGIFRSALAPDRLRLQTFNAGPAAVEALFSDGLDAAYVGPNAAINAYAKSHGAAIRIVSGATSGGAAFVVAPGITGPRDLKGTKIASPQLGGTQDVALRWWLRDHGIKTDPQGGGDVAIVPQDNAQTLDTFRSGAIAGAWVPEPWATRLVQDGGGKVLVDEATLWPEGRFVTTQLVVRTAFLRQHRATVRRLLEGQLRANEFVNSQTAAAQAAVNRGIATLTGKKLPDALIAAAWNHLAFTNDPLASTLKVSAAHAASVGLLDPVSLSGIYDLALLNQVLADHHAAEVRAI